MAFLSKRFSRNRIDFPSDNQSRAATPYRHSVYVEYLPYIALKHGSSETDNEIRLLVLNSGRTEDPLSADLIHATLDQAPAYTALSYACGQQVTNRKVITIRYKSKAYLVDIGESLAIVLTNIRNENQKLTLWVDAICIDQRKDPSSLQERSWQVGIMSSIYRKSSTTIVWLGLSNTVTEKAMKCMRAVDRELRPHLNASANKSWTEKLELVLTMQWLRIARPGTDTTFYMQLHQMPGLPLPIPFGKPQSFYRHVFSEVTGSRPSSKKLISSPDVIHGIQELCARTWWGRVWILQEYRLSPRIMFQCGKTQVSDTEFCRGVQVCSAVCTFLAALEVPFPKIPSSANLPGNVGISSIATDVLQSKHRVYDAAATGGFGTIQMVNYPDQRGDPRGSTDARDRIFAVLGILDDRMGIVPNYLIATEEVYQQFSEKILSRKNLYLLTRAHPQQNKLKLPSWSIDWTAYTPNTTYRTASVRKQQPFPDVPVTFMDISLKYGSSDLRRAMYTKGRVLGRISRKSESFSQMIASRASHEACKGHQHVGGCTWLMEIYLNMLKRHNDINSSIYHIVRLVLPDHFSNHFTQEEARSVLTIPSLHSCEDIIKCCAFLVSQTPAGFTARVAEHAALQRLVQTDTNHHGYSIEDAIEGDIIVQIGPYEHQVVLREIEPAFFTIIGGAHLPQTVQRGEVMHISEPALSSFCIV